MSCAPGRIGNSRKDVFSSAWSGRRKGLRAAGVAVIQAIPVGPVERAFRINAAFGAGKAGALVLGLHVRCSGTPSGPVAAVGVAGVSLSDAESRQRLSKMLLPAMLVSSPPSSNWQLAPDFWWPAWAPSLGFERSFWVYPVPTEKPLLGGGAAAARDDRIRDAPGPGRRRDRAAAESAVWRMGARAATNPRAFCCWFVIFQSPAGRGPAQLDRAAAWAADICGKVFVAGGW